MTMTGRSVAAEDVPFIDSVWGLAAGTTVSAIKTVGDSIHAIGEFAGMVDEGGETSTRDAIRSYAGDEAAAFYDRNPTLVEGAGLLASTIAPGTAGIKLLRIAQASKTNGISRLLALPANTLRESRDLAAANAEAGKIIFSALNMNTSKAILAGAGANVIDAAAFEVAAISATFAAPAYDDFNKGDYAKSVLTNIAVGGAIGTGFSAVKTLYGIGAATRVAEAKTASIRSLDKLGAAQQKPSVNLEGIVAELERSNLAVKEATAAGATVEAREAAAGRRSNILAGELTAEVSRLSEDAGINLPFANHLQQLAENGDFSTAAITVGSLGKITRGAEQDVTVTALIHDLHTGKQFAAGDKVPAHFGDTLSPAASVRTQGENLLVISKNAEPVTYKLAGKSFSQLTDMEAQASWMWHRTKGGIPDGKIAPDNLPAIEQLLGAGDELLKKRPAQVGDKLLRSVKEVEQHLFTEKVRQFEELAVKMAPEDIAGRLNVRPEFANSAEWRNLVARSGKEHLDWMQTPRHVSLHYELPSLTAAVDGLYRGATAKVGESMSSISMDSFLNAVNKPIKPLASISLLRSIREGKKFDPATITVKKDGSIVFDGNKRTAAVKKWIEQEGIVADYDHIPVKVVLQEGATLPQFLPDGSLFPTIKIGGKLVPNPLVHGTHVRLQAAFHQESRRLEAMNAEFNRQAHFAAAEVLAETIHMPTAEHLQEALKTVFSTDRGAGFATFTTGVTGGVGAVTQHIGLLVNKAIRGMQEVSDRALNAHVIAVKEEAGFSAGSELIHLDNYIKGNADNYVLAVDGSNRVVREDVAINGIRAARKAAIEAVLTNAEAVKNLTTMQRKTLMQEFKQVSKKESPKLAEAAEFRELSPTAFNLLKATTERNHIRLNAESKLREVSGVKAATLAQQHGLQRIYLPPVDTKKFSHHVFVRLADGITNDGHVHVLTAPSADALATKVEQLRREIPRAEFIGAPKSNYQFFYKSDVKAYHEALGDYEYSRGLNDSAIDSTIRSKKLMYDPKPPVTQEIVKNWADGLTAWNHRMDAKLVRDTVELKYAQPFKQLQLIGKEHEKIGTSILGGTTASAASFAAATVKNPYGDMLKQALDIGKMQEYSSWAKLNSLVNEGWARASLAVKKAGIALGEAKNPVDEEAAIAQLNEISDRVGFGNAYEAGARKYFNDQLAANPTLTRDIAKANAALNFFVLGSDTLQAFNTLIGMTVHATEWRAIRTGVVKADSARAGKLTGVPITEIEGVVEAHAKSLQEFFTGGKLWNPALGKYEDKTAKELLDGLVANGMRTGDAKMLSDAIDSVAFNSSTTPQTLGIAADKAMEFARKWSGNNGADAISKFVAARSMQRLTDKAMELGTLSSKSEANVYINQHLTRVHGASIASQRPVMFSGPVGQSIGMFMTFYVNLLQRMFQHAGAGDKAALATMAATQVGLYGLQGLPAFSWINTNVIGTASGNINHTDVYKAVGGSEDAKWIMYGAGSSLLGLIHPDLRVNLYSRGDLNPRQDTIIPINPLDTPIATAITKTVTNLNSLVAHISQGAGVSNSLLFALEHNGVSRPISGLGALLAGGQTTSKGGLLSDYSNGDFSVFAWGARLAGGKPLDDTLAADALYRSNAYKADRNSRMANLGESMRISMQNGEIPDVTGFMESYVHSGGDVHNFNRFMKKQFSTANNSQINKAAETLTSSEAVGLSRIMGGRAIADMEHPAEE